MTIPLGLNAQGLARLRHMQSWDLDSKIIYAQEKIMEFHNEMNKIDKDVSISFSGGKDSTVMRDIILKLYPDTKSSFADTGLEYPEIRDLVKSTDTIMIRPKKQFNKVLIDNGMPIISKKYARMLRTLQNPTENNKATRKLYLTGISKEGKYMSLFKLPKKWRYLIDAPFKISEECCNIIKKEPLKRYAKETNSAPYIGLMAQDGKMRESQILEHGCNLYGKNPQSHPLTIWTDKDIWKYIEKYNIEYSKIYDMGYRRTGCMFCMFGCHLNYPNRFQMMARTHPNQYDYCMNKLGLADVLSHLKVNYDKIPSLQDWKTTPAKPNWEAFFA